MPYPNQGDGPDTLRGTGSKKDQSSHKTLLRNYSRQLLAAYKNTQMGAESLSVNVRSAVRPHTVSTWTRPLQIWWFDLFTRRGIFVEETRTTATVTCLIDLLYKDAHIGTDKGPQPQEDKRRQADGDLEG